MEADGYRAAGDRGALRLHRPARYDDEIEIRTTGALLSPVRVQFDYEVVRRRGRGVLATGRTVHAALDRDGRPCRLPDARPRSCFA